MCIRDSITLVVQGLDKQISDKNLDISGLRLLQDEQIDLMGELGLSMWRPDIPPVIAEVIPGGAAAASGLMAEDRIFSINGEKIISAWHWVDTIRANPGNDLALVVFRDGRKVSLQLRPARQEEKGIEYGFIGVKNRIEIPIEIRREMEVTERYGPIGALNAALDKTWRMSWLTLKVLGKLIVGEASVKNLSGPITIARYAGISAQIGLRQFLGFLAIISISLGVLNLLPIPVLDGGHLFYYLIEMIKGSPVSEMTELVGQKIGMALLLGLMSVAIYNDLIRLVE